MRYQALPIVMVQGQWSVPDEVLSMVWSQMVNEEKAHKVFYNGYITTVYDFINFIKNSGVLPILIMDEHDKKFCHIAWISDYGGGHACLHHCSLGQFRRGAGKAILNYYEQFKDPETGGPAFDILVGITPENNEAAVRVAKLMGFKIGCVIPKLCRDVYTNETVGGVISYFEYHHGMGVMPWAEKAAAVAAVPR